MSFVTEECRGLLGFAETRASFSINSRNSVFGSKSYLGETRLLDTAEIVREAIVRQGTLIENWPIGVSERYGDITTTILSSNRQPHAIHGLASFTDVTFCAGEVKPTVPSGASCSHHIQMPCRKGGRPDNPVHQYRSAARRSDAGRAIEEFA